MNKSLLLLLFLINVTAFSQVGIGTTTPDASSVLHLNGTNKGLLLPRLSTVQRNAADGILSPVGGIVIYDTTLNSMVISLENGKWKNATTGTEGTTTSLGKIGIGTTSLDKNTLLEVASTSKGVLLPLVSDDFTAVQGMLYYNTTTNTVKIYSGSAWITVLTN